MTAERDREAPTIARVTLYFNHHRGVAQLVARTAGGREVAGSSPVTPTIDIGVKQF